MGEPTIDEMIAQIRDYAGKNRTYLELKGEVGFSRECVGLLHGTQYPSYSWESIPGDYMSKWESTEEATPPPEVTDAYHKHDCLAVLGRGDSAIRQLWYWVKKLEANGVVVVVEERQPTHLIDAIIHGFSRVLLKVESKETHAPTRT